LSRGDLTDAEWRILNPLLPDRGERGPPIPDKRRTVNGILWVLRTGAPWRDMPERYGNWNSVDGREHGGRLPVIGWSAAR
jgi:transposase